MSSLLKQDTFYNEYGDPGRIYTYPDRVSVQIDGYDAKPVFIPRLEATVEAIAFELPTLYSAGTHSELSVEGITISGIVDLDFSLVSEATSNDLQVSGDFQNVFMFADFYYQQTEDSPKSLDRHQFIITGD